MQQNTQQRPNIIKYILFSYQLLCLSYTDSYDHNKHIYISELTNSNNKKFKVIKDEDGRIRQMFSYLKQLQTKYTIILYTNKQYYKIQDIVAKLQPDIFWTYIGYDHLNYSHLYPNCPKLDRDAQCQVIRYGNHYSQAVGKQQRLIAIRSALNISSKESMLIIQPSQQQRKRLTACKYPILMDKVPGVQQLKDTLTNSIIKLASQQEQQLQISKLMSQSLSLHQILFPPIKQQSNQHPTNQTHPLQQIAQNINTSLNTKYYRLQSSNSICSLLFKATVATTHKIVCYAKCSLPTDIGGPLYIQYQQNKILAASIHKIISNQITASHCGMALCKCVPMWISRNQFIKHSQLQAHQKKRGCFVVRQFIKNINYFVSQERSSGQDYEQLAMILKNGEYKGKKVIGLGSLLAISILVDEKFVSKGFFDSISYYKNPGKQQLTACKIQFNNSTFSNKYYSTKLSEHILQNSPQKNWLENLQIRLIYSQKRGIKLNQLCDRYIQQIFIVLKVIQSVIPFIEAIFQFHIWSTSKQYQLKVFQEKLSLLKHYSQKNLRSQLTQTQFNAQNNFNKFQSIDTRWLSYLVEDTAHQNAQQNYKNNFNHFIKSQTNSLMFSSIQGIGENNQPNQYIAKMKQNANFIVYGNGNLIPVWLLINWIKNFYLHHPQTHKNQKTHEVQYVSLLTSKPSKFQSKIKQAKLDKKNTVFVVDHCQLDVLHQPDPKNSSDYSISQMISGLKTIFVYRLKKPITSKLQIIHDSIDHQQQLLKSEDQIFRAIFRLNKTHYKTVSVFEQYDQAIAFWIGNKCEIYGIPHKPTMLLLRNIVAAIACQKNRLISFYEVNSAEKLLLYALPIFIQKQRIYLAHDIYPFLQAKYLSQHIINSTWDGNLKGDQLVYFSKFYMLMDKQTQAKLEIKLQLLLRDMCVSNNTKLSNNEKYFDALQMAKAMGLKHLCGQLRGVIQIRKHKIINMIENNGYIWCLTSLQQILAIKHNNQQQNPKNSLKIAVQNQINHQSLKIGDNYSLGLCLHYVCGDKTQQQQRARDNESAIIVKNQIIQECQFVYYRIQSDLGLNVSMQKQQQSPKNMQLRIIHVKIQSEKWQKQINLIHNIHQIFIKQPNGDRTMLVVISSSGVYTMIVQPIRQSELSSIQNRQQQSSVYAKQTKQIYAFDEGDQLDTIQVKGYPGYNYSIEDKQSISAGLVVALVCADGSIKILPIKFKQMVIPQSNYRLKQWRPNNESKRKNTCLGLGCQFINSDIWVVAYSFETNSDHMNIWRLNWSTIDNGVQQQASNSGNSQYRAEQIYRVQDNVQHVLGINNTAYIVSSMGYIKAINIPRFKQ